VAIEIYRDSEVIQIDIKTKKLLTYMFWKQP